jgi:hypothetical protein
VRTPVAACDLAYVVFEVVLIGQLSHAELASCLLRPPGALQAFKPTNFGQVSATPLFCPRNNSLRSILQPILRI